MSYDFKLTKRFPSKITAVEDIKSSKNTDDHVDGNVAAEVEKRIVSTHVMKQNHGSIVPYPSQLCKYQILYHHDQR